MAKNLMVVIGNSRTGYYVIEGLMKYARDKFENLVAVIEQDWMGREALIDAGCLVHEFNFKTLHDEQSQLLLQKLMERSNLGFLVLVPFGETFVGRQVDDILGQWKECGFRGNVLCLTSINQSKDSKPSDESETALEGGQKGWWSHIFGSDSSPAAKDDAPGDGLENYKALTQLVKAEHSVFNFGRNLVLRMDCAFQDFELTGKNMREGSKWVMPIGSGVFAPMCIKHQMAQCISNIIAQNEIPDDFKSKVLTITGANLVNGQLMATNLQNVLGFEHAEFIDCDEATFRQQIDDYNANVELKALVVNKYESDVLMERYKLVRRDKIPYATMDYFDLTGSLPEEDFKMFIDHQRDQFKGLTS